MKKHFPDHIGALNTIQLVALNGGALIPPLLAMPLDIAFGWRAAVGIWAVPAVLATTFAVLLWLQHPRSQHIHHPVEASAAAEGPVLPMWQIPRAWARAALYGFTSWNVFILFTWLPALLVDAGQPRSLGGTMVSLIIGVSLIASFAVPRLTGSLRNTFLLTGTCAVAYVLGYTGLALAPGAAPVLWTFLVGIGCVLFPITLTMINTHARTHAGTTALSGFVQGIGCAIALLGPLLFGAAHALTGTWGCSYLLVAGAAVLAIAILGWRIRTTIHVEDHRPARTRERANTPQLR
ncbi:CynX/NimT family MFS transporter [Nocardioides sp. CPCC 206347]|uniref:MFS transporter n=1 Tax=Nocardioides sp. CPCC 206347 TaxID=3406463 RepID=UPI003B434290